MRLAVRGRRWAWIAAVTAVCLGAGTILLLFRDGHPHRLGWAGHETATTEADFEAVFGCPGRLVSGSRTPGTAYTVEWSDDAHWKCVSFGADGKFTEELGAPFFGCSSLYIPTPYEKCKLALRRMGFDAR